MSTSQVCCPVLELSLGRTGVLLHISPAFQSQTSLLSLVSTCPPPAQSTVTPASDHCPCTWLKPGAGGTCGTQSCDVNWWIIWRRMVGGDDLRLGGRVMGENTSMTVLPTERHDIVRKLLVLLPINVHKDLLKTSVRFHLVHPTILILARRKCLKMSSDGQECRWG